MSDRQIDGIDVPDMAAIGRTHVALKPYIRATPVFEAVLPTGLDVVFKMEMLQASGTFKARGAFSNLLGLDAAQRAAGVTCISAGNHAVAVAYAAMVLGISAKVVMLATANLARVALCRKFGAEILMEADGASGFARVHQIEADEGRFFVHPFNGYRTILGTATLGAEWARQAGPLDVVVLPIGGGGLAAGVATAFKLLQPDIEVIGVEPVGAASMARSFAEGGPIKMGPMQSIADSLMAPHTEAYSYGLCKRAIGRLTTVDDTMIRGAMLFLFEELKLAIEPACAVATAAVLGPLRESLAGKRAGVLLCGSNTDAATFTNHIGNLA
jgi:threonine dehydratase